MAKNITGRDSDILIKGLLYAIATIQNLPEHRQERSDMRDMCAIIRAHNPRTLMHVVYEVQAHTGADIDLWPTDDESLTEAERRDGEAFKADVSSYSENLKRQLEEFNISINGTA